MAKQSPAATTTPVQYTAQAINPENAGYNERRLTVLRMALSSFGGCIAGVLGLNWQEGLLFFLIISLIIFVVLFFFKIGAGQWKKQFPSFSNIWKSGLIPGFMVFFNFIFYMFFYLIFNCLMFNFYLFNIIFYLFIIIIVICFVLGNAFEHRSYLLK